MNVRQCTTYIARPISTAFVSAQYDAYMSRLIHPQHPAHLRYSSFPFVFLSPLAGFRIENWQWAHGLRSSTATQCSKPYLSIVQRNSNLLPIINPQNRLNIFFNRLQIGRRDSKRPFKIFLSITIQFQPLQECPKARKRLKEHGTLQRRICHDWNWISIAHFSKTRWTCQRAFILLRTRHYKRTGKIGYPFVSGKQFHQKRTQRWYGWYRQRFETLFSDVCATSESTFHGGGMELFFKAWSSPKSASLLRVGWLVFRVMIWTSSVNMISFKFFILYGIIFEVKIRR